MTFKTLAYIPLMGTDNVIAINTVNNQFEGDPIVVGDNPFTIAITLDGKFACVTNYDSDSVSVIDIVKNRVVGKPITVGKKPNGVAITPDGSLAYVVNSYDNNVLAIDIVKQEITKDPITVGERPEQIAITPDGKFACVTNWFSGTVSVIDIVKHKIVKDPITVGNGPYGIAITPDGKFACVTNLGSNNVSVIDIAKHEIVKEPITVGGDPSDIAITPDGNFAYVTNSVSNNVSVIDIAKHEIVKDPITVGDRPYGIAITPDGNFAYVTNLDSDNVSVIDIVNTDVETIPIPEEYGYGPRKLAIANVPVSGVADLSVTKTASPYGVETGQELTYTITVRNSGPDKATDVTLIDRLPIGVTFVSAETSHGIWSEKDGVFTCKIGTLGSREGALITIVVIPRQEGIITNTATIKGNEVDPNPDNNRVLIETSVYSSIPTLKTFAYVANSGANNVSVININNNTIEDGPIYVGEQPFDVAVTPDGEFAFVVNNYSNNVSKINTSDNQTIGFPVTVGSGPYGIAIDPSGIYAYVTNIYSDNLYKIKTESNTIEGPPINVGDGPVKIAIMPDGSKAYVTNYFSHDVTIVDLVKDKAVGSPISVGSNPFDIAITPDGRYAYVTSLGTDQVYVIDTTTDKVVFKPIPVGDGPFGIAITPDGKYAYIANYYSQNIYVIETFGRTLVKIIPVKGAIDIDITRDGSYAYVVNYNTNDVSVIDTTTYKVIKDSIPVGVYPRAIAIADALVLGTLTADLSVTKIDSPDPVKLGDNLTYTITVTNNGPDKATGVILKDTLPPSIIFVSAESSKGKCSETGGEVTCELGSLDNGESVTVTIVITPKQEGIITNTATVLANETDPDISNNTAIQYTMILRTICMEVTKTFDSCFLEDEITEEFTLPYNWCKAVIDSCRVRDTKCNVIEVTQPDEHGNVDTKIKVQVFVDIRLSHFCNTMTLKKVLSLTKTITIYAPQGAEVTCKVKDSSCECERIQRNKIRCTVNLTVISKSKGLVQLEVPYLDSCESKSCED